MHMHFVRTLGGLVLLVGVHMEAQVPTPATSQIVSAGSGVITTPGDRATVQVTISRRGSTAVEANKAMAPAVTRVQDTLRSVGASDDKVKIVSVTVVPVSTRAGERPVYEARTTISITTRDFAILPKVLDALLNAGVNEIPSLSFQSDSTVALRRRALALAVRTAREEAEVIASAMGGRLGRIIEMNSVDLGPVGLAYAAERKSLPYSVQIPNAEVSISAGVRARWEFIPSP